MLGYLSLACAALFVVQIWRSYNAYRVNLAAANQSGIATISTPIYAFNRFWLITHRLWEPLIKLLPKSYYETWWDYVQPDFIWNHKYETFRHLDVDLLMVVTPGASTLWVADAEAMNQITTRRNDFPKPTWLYQGVDIFGKNVVSSEGALWRHHRKVTSPPFTERNNLLVWEESLSQAESMMAGWIAKDQKSTGTLWTVATEAMRLSLHVISRAGFGVRLYWPHEQEDAPIPEGHTMAYKEALETLLENIIVLIIFPLWALKYSPLQIHKTTYRAYTDWGKYMREMYEGKRSEVKEGESRGGMDLMGALVKGAGITTESLNDQADAEKGGNSAKQLLTDEEILGNAFVFILAGHETAANTIHFSILFLAMKMSSQKRLQEDLDHILGDKPISQWSYEHDLPKLFGSMCGAVMNEELRLLPPVLGIPKSSTKDRPQGLHVNGKNYTVPAGAYVTLNTIAIHTNPKYWPHTSPEDLLEFRPERWLLDPASSSNPSSTSTTTDANANAYEAEADLDFDQTDKRPDTAPSLYRPPKGAYMPFSDGYRSCLGRRFAQVEILAVLAVIFKTWSVELDVSEYLSDADFARATADEKRAAWRKADARARGLLKDGMMTIITHQMRSGKVPFRFVRRGEERFAGLV